MVRWDVSFKNVTFGYRADTPVIRDVSLEIDEGSLVALVGETGAGKSTITNLIPRFYDAGAGSVRIGGYDVRSLDLNFLRENVAMVLQDVFLFQGTIRQNLLFGRPKATDQEVLAAARAANMEEFVARLPDGYETIVGERGVRLSAGQKQRVSIARALLKDAPILVLDEATSSVATETRCRPYRGSQKWPDNRARDTSDFARRERKIRKNGQGPTTFPGLAGGREANCRRQADALANNSLIDASDSMPW